SASPPCPLISPSSTRRSPPGLRASPTATAPSCGSTSWTAHPSKASSNPFAIAWENCQQSSSMARIGAMQPTSIAPPRSSRIAFAGTFLGWASDYSATILSVRNEGNSLSAIAHRLIAPRTRLILFLFIFFYLLLVGGAFGGILTGIMNTQPQAPLGIIGLVLMGLLLGQMLYRWRVGLIPATLITVAITFVLILLGPASSGFFKDTVNAGINNAAGN